MKQSKHGDVHMTQEEFNSTVQPRSGDVSGTLDSSGSGSKEDWDMEFEGKCVSCTHASPSNRKHQMNCSKSRAISMGLKTNGGGGGSPVNGYPVHRLFGCVYWEKPNDPNQTEGAIQ